MLFKFNPSVGEHCIFKIKQNYYMIKPESEYLTIKDAQKYLSCSRTTIHNLFKSRAIKKYYIGSSVRILKSELDALQKIGQLRTR
jgi:excisionase family DNA binding protein